MITQDKKRSHQLTKICDASPLISSAKVSLFQRVADSNTCLNHFWSVRKVVISLEASVSMAASLCFSFANKELQQIKTSTVLYSVLKRCLNHIKSIWSQRSSKVILTDRHDVADKALKSVHV